MNSFFRKKHKGLLVLLVLLPLITTFTIMNAETIFSWTPENEQEEKSAEDVIGEISFPEEMIQGEVDHVLDFIFYSEDALETVDLALPEQVIIDQESLIEGLTAVETENEGVWQLTSETPQTTFVLPIIVDTIGEYEIIVADSASQRLLIVENTVIEDIDQDEDENDSAEAAPEEEVDEASDEAAKEAEVWKPLLNKTQGASFAPAVAGVWSQRGETALLKLIISFCCWHALKSYLGR